MPLRLGHSSYADKAEGVGGKGVPAVPATRYRSKVQGTNRKRVTPSYALFAI